YLEIEKLKHTLFEHLKEKESLEQKCSLDRRNDPGRLFPDIIRYKPANKIDITDEACEEYSQEVLGFTDVIASGSTTPSDDPIVSTTSPTLTPFGDSDFLLLEEANAFLGLEDDPDSPKFNPFYYDPEGEILMLEAILNSDPSPSLPNHEQSMPSFKNELKACEAKTIKSSVDEPPEVRTYLSISNTHFWKATTSCPSLLLKSWEIRKNLL
nr:reverse transcriptase domain-containing protein [Tanacetum cinerariifolium]